MTHNRSRDALERVRVRRERHRRRPLVIRAMTVLAGGLLVAGALILLLPLPEAALFLAVVGLGLLALEFAWAARSLAWTLERASSARRSWRRIPRGWKAAGVAATAALILIAALTLASVPPFA